VSDPGLPDLRASDADRERTAERLRAAGGDGQLSLDELDERVQAAYTARTRSDLERLTTDLQPVGGATPAAASGPGIAVRPGEGGARWIVSIMSGSDRRGRWRLSPSVTALNIMGGGNIDLNQAELSAGRTELRVISIMGGSEIYVPENLSVEVSEFSFMGGNDIRVGESPPAGGPVLHVRLLSIMGGSSVKRGPRLSRAERRALKER
jgi:Domain of unknown function (DUF1707)/Cell wall-active antibiotics response 4TMS YvqF